MISLTLTYSCPDPEQGSDPSLEHILKVSIRDSQLSYVNFEYHCTRTGFVSTKIYDWNVCDHWWILREYMEALTKEKPNLTDVCNMISDIDILVSRAYQTINRPTPEKDPT